MSESPNYVHISCAEILPDLFLCLFLILFIQAWTWEKSFYYTEESPIYEVVTVSSWKYSEGVEVKAHNVITLYEM